MRIEQRARGSASRAGSDRDAGAPSRREPGVCPGGDGDEDGPQRCGCVDEPGQAGGHRLFAAANRVYGIALATSAETARWPIWSDRGDAASDG